MAVFDRLNNEISQGDWVIGVPAAGMGFNRGKLHPMRVEGFHTDKSISVIAENSRNEIVRFGILGKRVLKIDPLRLKPEEVMF